MTRKDLVNEWLLVATDDLDAAEHLFSGMTRVPLEIICFHCQQAGEKALKALLQHLGRDVPRTHDLVELRRLLGTDLSDDVELDRCCALLSAYGVTTRYPGRPELSITDAEVAFAAAKRILSSIRPLTE
ncbi:MAG: HEPN domain-containing protein [Spirochaetes bacterium]|nr:HEPN domain-containing protein [Spirochaetota bacterium]